MNKLSSLKALIRKWYKEIATVGVNNWLWFVVYLKRNEFSCKLDLDRYMPMDKPLSRSQRDSCYKRCSKDRKRAHEIDMVVSELC